MSDEKAPEEMPDVELPPVEPFNEPPWNSEVTPPPVNRSGRTPSPRRTASRSTGRKSDLRRAQPPATPSFGRCWPMCFHPSFPSSSCLEENMKNQPDLKPHTMQALVAGVAIIVITFVLGVIPIIGCLAPIVAPGGLDSDDLLGVPGVQRQRGHDPGRDEPRQDPGLGVSPPSGKLVQSASRATRGVARRQVRQASRCGFTRPRP